MGDTTVRTYTRNGRTVSGYTQSRPAGHSDPDAVSGQGDRPSEDPAAQKRRERFEKRVERERSGRRTPAEKRQGRAFGERKPRKPSHGKSAERHWRKANRTAKKRGWTRAYHRTAAAMFGVSAAGRWAGRKLRGEWS